MILTKANSFLSSEKAQTNIVSVVLGTLISVILAVIIGMQFLNIGTDMIPANDSAATNAMDNLGTIFWVIIGILVLIPLALVGKVVIGIFS